MSSLLNIHKIGILWRYCVW